MEPDVSMTRIISRGGGGSADGAPGASITSA
jgi:hypothetical protein